MELYKKYRPTAFKQLFGQDEVCKVLATMAKEGRFPHVVLLTGPSGTGKTTIGRILKDKLGCSDHDFQEINCADFKGIDTVRDIRSRMGLAPLGGKCKVWLIDEAHKLTNDAQTAFLKILEDTPQHCYFFLATTDPNKLLTTIKTRCTVVATQSLTPKAMKGLLDFVINEEKMKKVTGEVVDKIINNSNGSARTAPNLLDKVFGLDDEDEMLNTILSTESEEKAISIARALLNPKSQWGDVAKLLSTVDEEPESIRHCVLGYAAAILLKGAKHNRAYNIIRIFQYDWYNSKKPGMVAACYEVINTADK